MPLGTLDRTPPPFFKQGPSALSKLMLFSAVALFLMVADTRFKVSQPLRAGVATVLYPLQWLALRPVLGARYVGEYFESLHTAQVNEEQARRKLVEQSLRANQVDQLAQENTRLRKLLALRERTSVPSQAAEVLYDAADPFTRKVIIDKGLAHAIQPGSPVIDESGVVGQVTRVMPLVAEVTLITDREHAIPVLNSRTGARSVAYGDPTSNTGQIELRFMAGNADVQPGDVLTTSGVDGVYPAGIPVAKVVKVEHRGDQGFAHISCEPQARIDGARHVMVLGAMSQQLPPRPAQEPAPVVRGKGLPGQRDKDMKSAPRELPKDAKKEPAP